MAHSMPPPSNTGELVEWDAVSVTSTEQPSDSNKASQQDESPSRKISQYSNSSNKSSPQKSINSDPNSWMESSDGLSTSYPSQLQPQSGNPSPTKSSIIKVNEVPGEATYGSLSLAGKGYQNSGTANDNSGQTFSDEEGGQKRSDVVGDICRVFGVLFAIGVRAVLFGFCMFTIWLVVYRKENEKFYWLLAIPFGLLVPETFNIVISRAGQERKWVCLCFLCYLLSVIPCIWILELDRLESFQDAIDTNNNQTAVSVNVVGVTAEIKLDPNTTLAVTEQCLLFLLILGRWLLPRGDITRDQLSQLLFVYIGMASDVMELFQLFDEANVRSDRTLTYLILLVWSISLLQFTLVLTMSRSPKKVRTAIEIKDDGTPAQSAKNKKQIKDSAFILLLTQSELWSLCVSIFMQDGPFLSIRLYTIVRYSLINYTIIFFTCKNILVILLLLYRVLILFLENLEKGGADDDDAVNDKDDDSVRLHTGGRNRSKTESTNLSVSDIAPSSNSSPQKGNTTGKWDGVRSRNSNQVSPSKH